MTVLIAAVLLADIGLEFFTVDGLSGRTPLEVVAVEGFAYLSFFLAVWAPRWLLVSTVPSIVLTFSLADYEWTPVLILVGLLTTTALGGRHWVVLAWAWAVAWTTAAAVVFDPAHRVQFLALILAVAFLATSIGLLARRYFSQRDRHAHQLARVQALEQQSYEQELSLLAREIHDSIGHALTRAALQVQLLAPSDAVTRGTVRERTAPSAATEGLAAVGSSLDEAIMAMHHIVDVLENRAPLDDAATSIDLDKELSDLVDVLRSSGRTVRVASDAAIASTLSPSIQIECIRILQECTTNILRHSPRSAGVDVMVQVSEETVAMEVSNTVRAADAQPDTLLGAGGHHGLANMESRALRLGGYFRAGSEDGRWTVTVQIPVLSEVRTPARGSVAPRSGGFHS
ncbi:sensor histidine kinase [Raineyella sp. LH-20]|uniref:sensor histidine kinase n=1 Tax=Raineyella sp. LH-20 TaxID=3081204 RepID=UPI0029536BC3|nr:histidine kinase [Raineyella sp. LH-20]WOP18222.1 histidine kinase [Raineyella sp. LH-20]